MGGIVIFANGADQQAGARAGQYPCDNGNTDDRQIDKRVVSEQYRPEHRDIRHARDIQLGETAEGFAHIGMPDQGAEPETENGERKTRRNLVGLQIDGQHAENERDQHAGAGAGCDRQNLAPGRYCCGKGRDGADDHHAFDAEVQNPRLFDHNLADRREYQGRRCGDDCEQGRNQPVDTHSAASTLIFGAPKRTRYLIRTSEASRKNSSMPWNTPVTAFGRFIVICAESPPR